MKKIVLVFMLIFTAISTNFAATGCLYSSSGYVYITPGGSGAAGVPNYTYSTSSDRIAGSSYCVVVTGGSNSCYINVPSSPSSSAYGVLANYGPLPCPLDSELYILMIVTAGFSCFLLKNRSFSI